MTAHLPPQAFRNRKLLARTTALLVVWSISGGMALAQTLPTNGNVVSGVAVIDPAGAGHPNSVDVTLTSQQTVIEWDTFNIATGKTVNFNSVVPVVPYNVLNRVVTLTPSVINGTIASSSNVSVWLINPSGILVGNGAAINTNGLFLSTLNIADSDFAAGTYHLQDHIDAAGAADPTWDAVGVIDFTGASTLTVNGTIGAIGQIINANKTLTATGGDIALVAGTDVTLDYTPGSPLGVTVTSGTTLASAKVTVGATGQLQANSIVMAGAANMTNTLLGIDSGAALTAIAVDGRVIISVGTTEAATVTQAGVTFAAAGSAAKIDSQGALTAQRGDVIVAGVGDVAVTGGVIAGTTGTNGNYTVSGANVTLGGTQGAKDAVSVTAVTNLTGNANLVLTSNKDNNNALGIAAGAMTLEATAGTLNLASGSSLLGGTLAANKTDIDFTAGAGTVVTVGDIDANLITGLAAGDLTGDLNTGLVKSVGDVALGSTGGNVVVEGVTVSGTGKSAVINGTTGTVSVIGPVSVDKDYTVSGGDITLGGTQGAKGIVSISGAKITADGGGLTLTSNSDATGTEALNLTATDDIDLTGSTLNGGTAKQSNVAIDVTGASGKTVTLGAVTALGLTGLNNHDGDITLGNLSVTDALTVKTTAGTLTAANIAVSGSGNDATLEASGAASVIGTVTVARDYSVTGSTVTVGGTQSAARRIILTSTTGGITGNSGAVLTSDSNNSGLDNLTLDSAGTISFAGTTLNTGTGVNHTADVEILSPAGQTVTLGDVNAKALTGLGARNATVVAGDISIEDGLNISTATGNVTVGNATSNLGTLNLEATSGTVTAGTLSSGDEATLNASGAITTGTIDVASNNLTVTGGSVDIGAVTVTSGNLSVDADNGDATLAGGTVGGTASVTTSTGTGDDVILTALLQSAGNATITSVSDANLFGVTSTAGDITVTADSGVVTGVNPATDATDLQANQGLTVSANSIRLDDATATNGALSLTADTGDVTAGAVTAGTTASLTTTAGTGDVSVTGGLTTGNGSATISAFNGDTSVDGTVTVVGGNYVIGGNTVTLGGTQRATGAIILTGGAGGIAHNGALALSSNSDNTGAEALTLTSAGDIALGSTTLNGGLNAGTASKTSNIVIGGTASANVTLGTVNALALTGLTAADSRTGTVTLGTTNVTNSLDVETSSTLTTAAITVSGAAQTAKLKGNTVIATTVSADGEARIEGTAGAQATSLTSTSGDIVMTTVTGDAQLGTGSALNGTASLTTTGGTGDVVVTTSLTSDGTATVTSFGGDTRLVSVKSNSDAITVTAAGEVTGLTTGDRANLDANGVLSVTGGAKALLGTANGSAIGVTADTIDATTATASTGNLSLVSDVGVTTLGTGSALGGTATVTGQTNATVTTSLTASGLTQVTATTGAASVNGITSNNANIAVTGQTGASVTTADAKTDLAVTATTGTASLGTGTAGDSAIVQALGGNATVTTSLIAGTVNTASATVDGTTTANAAILTASADVILNAGTAATGGALTSSTGDVIVTGDSLNVTTATATVGALDLHADNGDLTLGTGTAGTTANIRTTGGTGDLAINTGLTTTSGDATVSAVGDVTIVAPVSSGADYSVSGDTITLGGTQGGKGAVTLTAGAGGIAHSGALTLTANTDATGTEALTLNASGAIALGGTTLNGGPARQSDVAVNATAQTVVLGAVNAAALTGLSTQTANVTLGNVSVVNGLQVGTTGTLITGDVAVTGANQTLSLIAGGALTSDDLTSDGALTAEATGAMQASSVDSVTAAASLKGSTVTVTTAHAGSLLTAEATNGDLTLGTGTAGSALLKTTGGTAGSGDVIVTSLTTTNDATINAFSDARVPSLTSTSGNISVTAVGEVTGALTSTRSDLSAANGTVTVAGGSKALLGTVTAKSGVDVTADTIDATTVNNTTSGVLSLNADNGDVRINTGTSGGTADIRTSAGTGDVVIATSLITTGDASVSSSGGDTRLPLVTSNAGAVTISAAGEVTGLTTNDRANLNAATAVTVAGGAKALLGPVTGGTNITATADTIDITTATATAGALSLIADNGDVTLGSGTAGTTAEVRTTTNPGDVTISTLLTTGGAATVTSTRNAAISGTVTVGGGYIVSATGDVTLAGVQNATGAIDVSGAKLTGTSGLSLTSDSGGLGGRALTLTANTGTINFAGTTLNGGPNKQSSVVVHGASGQAVTLGDVNAAALTGFSSGDAFNADITFDDIAVTNALDMRTSGGFITGDTVDVATGSLTLSGGAGVTANTLTAPGAVAILGGGDIQVTNATSSGGSLTLASTGGDVTLDTGSAATTASISTTGGTGDVTITTSLTSGGTATVQAGTIATVNAITSTLADISVSGASVNVTTADAATNLTLTATAGDLILDTGTAGNDAAITATGDATVLTSLTAGDTATFLVGGVTNAPVINSLNIDITSATVDLDTIDAAGSLKITTTTGNLTVNTATAGTTADLNSAGAATVATSLVSGGAASVTAGTDADVALIQSTGGNVSVSGVNASVTTANAGGALAATATGGDATLGTGTAMGTALVKASGNAGVTGTLTSGGTATVEAGQAATINTIESTLADVSVSGASGSITTAKAKGRLIFIATAGDAVLGTGEVGTTADIDASGDATVTTSLTSAGNATLSAGGDASAPLIVSTGGDVRVTGDKASIGTANAGGKLILTATAGDATLGSGTAATTAEVKASGNARIVTFLKSGGTALLTAGGTASAPLVTSTGGDITVSGATVDITTANAMGALNLTAATGNARLGTGTAGTALALTATAGDATLGNGTAGTTAILTVSGKTTVSGSLIAGGAVTLTAGSDASAGTLQSTGGDVTVTGTTVAVGNANAQGALQLSASNGGITLGAGTSGTTTLIETTGGAGDVVLTSLTSGGATTIRSVDDARLGTMTSAGDVSVIAANLIQTGGIAAAGRAIRLDASDADITGDITGKTVTVVSDRSLRLGSNPEGAAGFDLSEAEINHLKPAGADSAVTLDAGGNGVAIGDLAWTLADAGTAVNIFTTGRVDLSGRLVLDPASGGSGSAASRTLILGGSATDDEAMASVIRVSATASDGGRIDIGDGTLELRGAAIGVGQELGFLDSIGVGNGATPLTADQAAGTYVNQPSSTLYRARNVYTDPLLVRAGNLKVKYSTFAMFQNTGVTGTNGGTAIGTAALPGSIELDATTASALNAFGLFGRINQIDGVGSALLGQTVIKLNGQVTIANTRINGCIVGAATACLSSSLVQPPLNVFDNSQVSVLTTAAPDLSFESVISSNNETLFADIAAPATALGQPASDSTDDEACDPAANANCPAKPAEAQ